MAAFPITPSGGMIYHPYYYKDLVDSASRAVGRPPVPTTYISSRPPKGKWVHNPYHVAWRGVKGAGLATAIGVGNFLTRNYRQKPVVGLQTATHTRVPKAPNSVSIPTVSSRRTKDYSRKKILSKSKAMPYRKKYTRTGRKRIYRRTKRKPKIPLGIARKKLVRFRCVGNDTLTGNSGALATKMIKMNSLNAPIGGTILPATLDQWAAFYDKYTVIGSKLTVTFSNTTNTGPVHVGLHLHKNNTALASHAHYRELPMTRNKFLTTNRDLCTISIKYSGKKFWHLGSITSDSEQEATLASGAPTDPTDIAYGHIFIQDVVGANNSIVDIQMALELICVLNEPINVARSSV